VIIGCADKRGLSGPDELILGEATPSISSVQNTLREASSAMQVCRLGDACLLAHKPARVCASLRVMNGQLPISASEASD